MPDRRLRGAAAPNAFFTVRQVAIIRARAARGERIAALAAEYECSYKTVWRVVNRATYRGEELTDACPNAQG